MYNTAATLSMNQNPQRSLTVEYVSENLLSNKTSTSTFWTSLAFFWVSGTTIRIIRMTAMQSRLSWRLSRRPRRSSESSLDSPKGVQSSSSTGAKLEKIWCTAPPNGLCLRFWHATKAHSQINSTKYNPSRRSKTSSFLLKEKETIAEADTDYRYKHCSLLQWLSL